MNRLLQWTVIDRKGLNGFCLKEVQNKFWKVLIKTNNVSKHLADNISRQHFFRLLFGGVKDLFTNIVSNLSLPGKSVKVHVMNLTEPHPKRRVRELDTKHVQFLEESYLNNPGADYSLLAGMLVTGDINKAAEVGGVVLEVIGGNHRRAVLTSLFRRGLREPYVDVIVYDDLETEQALKIGYFHNVIATKSLGITFVDKVNIVKKYKSHQDMKKKLMEIFGYKVGKNSFKKIVSRIGGQNLFGFR